ncbi:hypothetical protein BN1708_019967, partial [Verticillium longisporum]
HAPQEPH